MPDPHDVPAAGGGGHRGDEAVRHGSDRRVAGGKDVDPVMIARAVVARIEKEALDGGCRSALDRKFERRGRALRNLQRASAQELRLDPQDVGAIPLDLVFEHRGVLLGAGQRFRGHRFERHCFRRLSEVRIRRVEQIDEDQCRFPRFDLQFDTEHAPALQVEPVAVGLRARGVVDDLSGKRQAARLGCRQGAPGCGLPFDDQRRAGQSGRFERLQIRLMGRGACQEPWRIAAAASHDEQRESDQDNGTRDKITEMHTIQPARLKQGVDGEALREPRATGASATGLIRGKALIFWDPKSLPGTKFAKKLDAIDTDQITPAADCVSESLETLDEKWKAGSFRYLMPDFRARVHRGENFIIAGDRFAIGSSREMSPAGLKGVAEEAGLEMVVVAANNMGDIFRRNSFNLGLHVVQSPDAVADAQDGDAFSFDPVTRHLRNETRQKDYDPVPLSPKEEEIRRSGGIFTVGRREFKKSVLTKPSIDWADPSDAQKMTSTEQVIWAHRVDKDLKPSELKPGTTLRVYADLLTASDGTAPFSIHTCNQITGGSTIYPRQAAIANDHFVFTGVDADDKQANIGRQFAKLQ